MDQLGLVERLLELPHTKMSEVVAQTVDGAIPITDLHRAKTKYPFVAMMPQARFLEFVTHEAASYPAFCLRMGARVDELVIENDGVCGVRYAAHDGRYEVRALVTIGTDGRFSMMRKLGGFQARKASPPIDVLWFRLPRRAQDTHGLMARFGRGHLLIELERGEQWQLAFVIPKGSYQQLKAAGIQALREAIVDTAPEFKERVNDLNDWKQVALLSVEADRLPRWYRPGLLLIGDAAHVMSPAGGNGINYAVQDAVATANILSAPLRKGQVTVEDLARVQRRRELPTRVIQAIVNVIQEQGLKAALAPGQTLRVPSLVRMPIVKTLIANLIAFGIRPESVECG
jgi:2-polyprenyl-6-methoxyphenol hydroxylase-like FAD-dependent oxidoreductase